MRPIKPSLFEIKITYTERELADILDLATRRYVPTKRVAGSPADQRVIDHDITGFERHRRGLMGEVAVSRLLNLPVDETIYEHGDPGWDFVLYGTKIDVKTSQGYLIVRDKSRFKADAIVLVNQEAREPSVVRVQGFINREGFWAGPIFKEDFGHGGEDFCMQPADMFPMHSLKEHCWNSGKLRWSLEFSEKNFNWFENAISGLRQRLSTVAPT